MPSARAAVHTALPLLALVALGALAALQPAGVEPALVSAGVGSVRQAVEGRILTDGHPAVVRVRRVPITAPAAPPVARTSAQPVRVARHTPRAASVAAPAPKAVPTAVPRVRSAPRDSYPYATDTSGDSDPWGFTKRQCVSYVAWRLAEAGRPLDNGRDHWDSALDWDDTATRLGYAVSSRPAVGAVAQWNAGEHSAYWSGTSASSDGTFVAGAAGHVAWVTSVYSDGSVQVAQYNGTGDRTYSVMRVRAPRYLSL